MPGPKGDIRTFHRDDERVAAAFDRRELGIIASQAPEMNIAEPHLWHD
jgi:hypothetical protein